MQQNLNKEQKQAVTANDKRLLILAGAGTGKTLVLTTRIAYLINELHVPPGSILGLTFTNKAASEMKTRLAKLISKEAAKKVTLSTFHSFCMHLLRKEIHHLGYTNRFTLYHPTEVERLLHKLARDLLNITGEMPSIQAAIQAIRGAQNQGLLPHELPPLNTGAWYKDFIKDLYQSFLNSLRAHNAVDFDSLLFLTLQLLKEHPALLEKYQTQFSHVLIDEYQDTNPIQYKIAAELSKRGNLCVVGDDDQSIYGWRGADIRNILEFGDSRIIKLEQNYRSTSVILKAANAVIQNNPSRHGKELWSSKNLSEPLHVFHAPTEQEEAQGVIYRLLHLKEKHGLRLKDFAILYRSNSLSRQMEQLLLRTPYKVGANYIRGIPYQIFGGLEFFERAEVKDLFCYLRVLVNPLDQEALLRIINQPRRSIGDQTLDTLTRYNRQNNIPLMHVLEQVCEGSLDLELPTKSLNGIRSFLEILQDFQKEFEGSLPQALEHLIERIHYKKALFEEVKSDKMREIKWENVQELIHTLSDYEKEMTSQEKKPSLHDFVAESPLKDPERMKRFEENHDAVQLMTFHSAKGLEFPVCFLVGLEDHIIPHERSKENHQLEEERRLMYVALTRAKDRLILSMSKLRNRMGETTPTRPSRFLYEIPKDLLKIVKWDDVSG